MSERVDLRQALDVARNAAEAGAAIAMRKRDSAEELIIQAKAQADFVTDVDKAAQAAIIQVIQETYPDHRILAEEEGADALGNTSSPYRWIIDPLDGTTVYIHGKDSFGTIVALQENNETVVGAMTIPMRNERFWGSKGNGAFFNGQRITSLRPTQSLNDAILCTNLGRHELALNLPKLRCASLQNYGCAAVEIGDVLKGENDGVAFDSVRLWDCVAGLLMIAEAGGKVRWAFRDANNDRGRVFAVGCTKPIYEDLEKFVFGSAHA